MFSSFLQKVRFSLSYDLKLNGRKFIALCASVVLCRVQRLPSFHVSVGSPSQRTTEKQ